MLKCARCDDYLVGHTCHSCSLRHRCLDKRCGCRQYPNLPLAFGNMSVPNVALREVREHSSYELVSSHLREMYRLNKAGIGRLTFNKLNKVAG